MNTYLFESYSESVFTGSTVENWLSHNYDSAVDELGEDLVSSILEGIDYE